MKKKIIFLIISIFLVILILFSSTYALLFKTDETDKQSYKTGILDITSESLSGSVTINNQLPISDSDGENSTPYIFRITNKGNLSYKFNIMLLSTTTDNQIEAQYIKVKVNEDEPIKLNSLTNGIILSDITLKPTEYIDVTLRVWLDINTPNTQIGKTFNAKITTEGQAVYTEINLDKSGANEPDLVDGLIPVVYNESTSNWVKADSTNSTSTYQWYDYNNKLWANAVLVTETNRDTYKNASAGTVITESDILAYYVWIPRYKYKVWNINKVIGTDSYNAQNTGIDIVFENGKKSTGTINCEYNYNVDTSNGGIDLSTTIAETCTGSNGDYYTHPAFTFGNDELKGFWIGKFELTRSSSLTILPNKRAMVGVSVKDLWDDVYGMQETNSKYGLNTSKINTDSHMITNMEWGAVAYLTNSKYGRCINGSCQKVQKNSYGSSNDYISMTGCGPVADGSDAYAATCNTYNTTLGQLASTTGNITGVYDMSGGVMEFVMANLSKTNGFYTFNPNTGDFTNDWYTNDTAKYITTYAYATYISGKVSKNIARLGDATEELLVSYNDSGYYLLSWCGYSDKFPVDGEGEWVNRGGYSTSSDSCIFDSGREFGVDDYGILSSRAILASLK